MAKPSYRLSGYIGDGQNTASALGEWLARYPGKPVEVIVNSPGGAALEAAAILAEVQAHGKVDFLVRGVAASAASLIICGGREVVIHEAAMLMMHLPWVMTVGDADAHRSAADVLDKVGKTDAAIYARSSGQPLARVTAWLADELWLTAAEAVALGFADRIEKGGQGEPAARHDYTANKGAPAALMQLARENGWVAKPPEQETKEQEKTDA